MNAALSGDGKNASVVAAPPLSAVSQLGSPKPHAHPIAFWDLLKVYGRRIALLSSAGEQISYQDLADCADRFAATLPRGRKLLVHVTSLETIEGIAAYLGTLRAGHAVLADPAQPCAAGHASPAQVYRPDIVVDALGNRAEICADPATALQTSNWPQDAGEKGDRRPINPDLAIVMSTSGSMGDPKAVRLSRANVAENARQIVIALEIDGDDRAVSSLPGHFIYGLSVLNSHLAAGASYFLSGRSIFSSTFWREAESLSVNSFAGVPYTFRALRQLGLERAPITSFRKVCHSGGFLDDETFSWFSDRFVPPQAAVYFMYGQTEAAGRIAVLPPTLSRAKPGAVGAAVPGGRIAIASDGEVIFTGPNVMMGYAMRRDDLALGDECDGVLHTGDLGEIDADGMLWITGRRARIVKVMGKRVSLDALEARWQAEADLAVLGDDDRIVVFVEREVTVRLTDCIAATLRILGLPPGTVQIRSIPQLPRTDSGKIRRSRLCSQGLS